MPAAEDGLPVELPVIASSAFRITCRLVEAADKSRDVLLTRFRVEHHATRQRPDIFFRQTLAKRGIDTECVEEEQVSVSNGREFRIARTEVEGESCILAPVVVPTIELAVSGGIPFEDNLGRTGLAISEYRKRIAVAVTRV